MNLKILINTCFLFTILTSWGQETRCQQFKKLSCAEKRWVLIHPFVAKKAYHITVEVRQIVEELKKDTILKGRGNGLQIDAFRHTYWMALLTKEIGWSRAKRLGEAHEKGNYQMFKKRKLEDGELPDQKGSEMDLYNNTVGIDLGKNIDVENLKYAVIKAIQSGKCKILKMDERQNYLNCDGEIIPKDSLKGKWLNDKCLVSSDEVPVTF